MFETLGAPILRFGLKKAYDMRFNYGSRFCRPLELGWNVSTPVQESAVY
jgi:hypothetical protein